MGRNLSGSGGGGSSDAKQALVDAGTINWNMAAGNIATVTLGGNRIIANPTNLRVGGVAMSISQDATGSRTITSWGSLFKFAGGAPPILSTAANATDVISGIYDGTFIRASYIRGA